MRRILLLTLVLLLVSPGIGAVETFGESGSTLPEITNISIYDVSSLSGDTRYTEGDLVTYGVNTTLNISQQDNSEYRVNITIVNDQGDEPWVLNESDDLYHEGLDTGWTVNEIFYDITGDSRRFGGSFSSGRVTWDTGNGGDVATDERLIAAYLVEIDNTQSQSYDGFARVSDTNTDGATESGSNDSHIIDVTKVGFLNMTLLEPPNSTIVQQNLTFTMNSSIECFDGQCGEVTAQPRYGSTTPDTILPDGAGDPFHTTAGNEETCSTDLGRGETCYSSFTVNATGNQDTEWWLDVNASSSYTELDGNDTGDHNVTIDAAVFMNLDFSSVSFGSLDPGVDDEPAQRNDEGYNITIADNSRPVDNIWVKGTDLVHENFSSYTIGPSNISVTNETNDPDPLDLSYTYQQFVSDINPGEVVSTFFFIDIPLGLMKGDYNGTITFKANTTQ